MTQPAPAPACDRRCFLIGAASASLLLALLGAGSAGAEATSPESAEYKAALAAVLASATPVQRGLTLQLPESAENGEHVPVMLSAESAMTPESYVKAVHLLSTANPRASVATFRFTPRSGRAQVTTSMRLAKTQYVVAIAERSDGTLLIARQHVDVKIGGCGI